MPIQTKNGVVVTVGGAVASGGNCCCNNCLDCSVLPTMITIQFTSEPSLINTPSGWIGTWTLHSVGGCCYELTTGLPGTCTKFQACIITSGSSGIYELQVYAYYPGGGSNRVGFDALFSLGAPSNDCKANGNGSPTTAISLGGGTTPIDFVEVSFHPSYVTITST